MGNKSETPITDNTSHNVAELAMLCRKFERQLRQESNSKIKKETFSSTEPIEVWMEKNFPDLWEDFKCHCFMFGKEEKARYFAMSFQNRMYEILKEKKYG